MRSTSDSGRKLNRYTPRVATLASVEKAITGMPRLRANCPTGATELANSGPRTISAPSSSACWAACCAPCTVPASSLTRSWMLGELNSDNAISAAFFMDCAARPALPLADSGRTSATLTCPVPMALLACGSGWRELVPRSGRFVEQAAAAEARAAASSATHRRRDGAACRSGRLPLVCAGKRSHQCDLDFTDLRLVSGLSDLRRSFRMAGREYALCPVPCLRHMDAALGHVPFHWNRDMPQHATSMLPRSGDPVPPKAADLTFLAHLPRTRFGTSNRKAARGS